MTIPKYAANASTKIEASVHGGKTDVNRPVLTRREGGLRDERITGIQGRGLALPQRASVSRGRRLAVSRSCARRTARTGTVSAAVHELHPRSGFPDGLFPLPDISGLLGDMWPAMPLPDASAPTAAGELRHAFLLAGPVVLRYRLLRIRYVLLRQ